MRFSDEMLMAYADGELDPTASAEIEAEMSRDPAVARAVERHRALRGTLRDAYAGVLKEPVPERLAALVSRPATTNVANLATRRAAARIGIGRWQLPAWTAMAASVVVGLLVGILVTRSPAPSYEETSAGLVARGELAAGLTRQLASAPADANVRIGITFRNRQGDYCRTFTSASEAGLACRDGEDWRIEVLAAAPAQAGDIRTAAALPLPVLHAVDSAMDGEPLDAAREMAARDSDWR
jgi:negative regulator of sigma E activity